MTTNHTPLPFSVTTRDLRGVYVYDITAQLKTKSGKGGFRRIAELTTSSKAKDDADFIVRACNSHYDLIEALELLLDLDEVRYTDNEPVGKAFYAAKKALAKARGEA